MNIVFVNFYLIQPCLQLMVWLLMAESGNSQFATRFPANTCERAVSRTAFYSRFALIFRRLFSTIAFSIFGFLRSEVRVGQGKLAAQTRRESTLIPNGQRSDRSNI
jgi:hypothetical protein